MCIIYIVAVNVCECHPESTIGAKPGYSAHEGIGAPNMAGTSYCVVSVVGVSVHCTSPPDQR